MNPSRASHSVSGIAGACHSHVFLLKLQSVISVSSTKFLCTFTTVLWIPQNIKWTCNVNAMTMTWIMLSDAKYIYFNNFQLQSFEYQDFFSFCFDASQRNRNCAMHSILRIKSTATPGHYYIFATWIIK